MKSRHRLHNLDQLKILRGKQGFAELVVLNAKDNIDLITKALFPQIRSTYMYSIIETRI